MPAHACQFNRNPRWSVIMNRNALSPASRYARSTLCFLSLFLLLFLHGQPARSQQNNEYTKKIRDYTTQPYFMTELVDHLPTSDKVPSPDKVLGYIVGTP